MKTAKIILAIFILAFALFMRRQLLYSNKPESNRSTGEPVTCPQCHAVLPKVTEFYRQNDFPPHYKAYATGRRDLAGIVFSTKELVPEIKGYSGTPVELMVGIDPQGTIMGIEIISHAETPDFVKSIQSFIKQFVTLDPNNSFALGKDIDGMTGATITSEAISQSIKQSLLIINRSVLSKDPSGIQNQ